MPVSILIYQPVQVALFMMAGLPLPLLISEYSPYFGVNSE